MQHINKVQVLKIRTVQNNMDTGLKSGKLMPNDPQAIHMQNQINNFMGCVRKSVRKYML